MWWFSCGFINKLVISYTLCVGKGCRAIRESWRGSGGKNLQEHLVPPLPGARGRWNCLQIPDRRPGRVRGIPGCQSGDWAELGLVGFCFLVFWEWFGSLIFEHLSYVGVLMDLPPPGLNPHFILSVLSLQNR